MTGGFVDGWYPDAYWPIRPVNLVAGSLTATTDTGAVYLHGTGAEDGGAWDAYVWGPAGNGGPLPEVGPADLSVFSGPGFACGSALESHAEVLEAMYNGPTVVRFAATIWTRCPAVNPLPQPVRMDIRYHSTIGFQAFSITPPLTAPFGLVPPDLDLGTTRVGEAPATGSFTVQNSGSLPLAIGAGTPSDAAFSVEPGSCDGSPIAAGASCSIDLAFDAPDPYVHNATVALETPDLDRLTRDLRIRGKGIEATSVGVSMGDTSTIESYWPGLTWFDLSWTPEDFKGALDITTTCGKGSFGAVVPPGTSGRRSIVDPLPPGPCHADVSLYGLDGAGWEPSSASIDFTVLDYADVWAWVDATGQIVRAGDPIDLHTSVAAVNGASPAGGTLTVTDETDDTVLVDRAVTPATLEAVTPIGLLAPGVHPLRVAYSGDGTVQPWFRHVTLTVDGDDPTGTVDVDDGAAYTNDPAVQLDLAATDPTSDVTQVRVSNSPATSGGVLTSGTTSAAVNTLAWQLVAGDGSRPVYVQWRDAVGNWSNPTSDSIVVDSAKPVIGTPSAVMLKGGAWTAGGVPVQVTVSATDATSGIATRGIQQSRDGGAWVLISNGSSGTAYATPGHSFRYRGIATDGAGNAAIGPVSATVTPAIVSESSGAVTRTGSWTSVALSTAHGGKVVRSATIGSSLSYRTTARQIGVLAPLRPSGGSARIYVDGVYKATVSLYRSPSAGTKVVYVARWSTAGPHTVRVVVSKATVYLDGFARIL